MMERDLLSMLFSIAVPVLFWLGVIFGLMHAALTSSPYFLGSPLAFKSFGVIVALFLLYLAHDFFGWPYLGSLLVESLLVILGFAVCFGAQARIEKEKERKIILQDPTAQVCPKCRAVVDRIFVECPRCEADLAETRQLTRSHR